MVPLRPPFFHHPENAVTTQASLKLTRDIFLLPILLTPL